ncbi:MAG: 6-phosphogluconolactonase [Rhodospirillaceae bacterium]|jgi:6-phosphogluconolactonase|nr:6-phosphogluconolactonase [Rhodospirillaceae bacterium]
MSNKRIIVAPDLSALVEEAANRIAARISQSGDRAAICLTGGSTPKPVYERLATEPYRSAIPWDRTHWFWGDDRFVPLENGHSNAGMALRAFLEDVSVPSGNIHPIPTDAATPEDAARRYQAELERFYGRDQLDAEMPLFDLVLMGLGSDGHIASLFPGAPALTENDRWAVGVAQAGIEPFVPRVTLTIPAMASTREMLFLVCGPDKREILGRVLSGENLPAASAQAVGELIWLADRDAAPAAYPEGTTTI